MNKILFTFIALLILSSSVFAIGIGVFGDLASARIEMNETYSIEIAANYKHQSDSSNYFMYGGSILYNISNSDNLDLNIGISGTAQNGIGTSGSTNYWGTGIFFEPDYYLSDNFMMGLRLYPMSYKSVTSAGNTLYETNYLKATIGAYLFL